MREVVARSQSAIGIVGLALVACGEVEAEKKWTVTNPSLEERQRSNPQILKSSHQVDPALPTEVLIHDPTYAVRRPFLETLRTCEAMNVELTERYYFEPQMPPVFSFSTQQNQQKVVNCVRSNLPDGFELKEVN